MTNTWNSQLVDPFDSYFNTRARDTRSGRRSIASRRPARHLVRRTAEVVGDVLRQSMTPSDRAVSGANHVTAHRPW